MGVASAYGLVGVEPLQIKNIYRMVEGWEQHGVLAVIFLAQMFCLQKY